MEPKVPWDISIRMGSLYPGNPALIYPSRSHHNWLDSTSHHHCDWLIPAHHQHSLFSNLTPLPWLVYSNKTSPPTIRTVFSWNALTQPPDLVNLIRPRPLLDFSAETRYPQTRCSSDTKEKAPGDFEVGTKESGFKASHCWMLWGLN